MASDAAQTTTGPVRSAADLVDYAASLDCIHCGLCLQSCPTFRLTGAEASSPRGRIHLMRAVGEDRLEVDASYSEEMDFCLLCRHCESVCPAGVSFASMMEFTRERMPRSALARLGRWIGYRGILPHRLVLASIGAGLRFAVNTGIARMLGRIPGPLGRAWGGLKGIDRTRKRLPLTTPAQGQERGAVALLEGCIVPEFLGRTNAATASSLSKLGLACHVPDGAKGDVVCCGSLHAHNGDAEGARDLARRLIPAYESMLDGGGNPLPIVVNSAGCGSHLRELHHLFEEGDAWHGRARDVALRIRDYSEVVAPFLMADGGARLEGSGPVAWDSPCHLCHGQGIRAQPIAALDAIAGLERVPLDDPESCCGSAGIYSLLRPNDSQDVLAPRLDALARSGARTLVTANPGCQLQWSAGVERAGMDVRVVHLAEVVDEALGNGDPDF